MFNNWSVDVPSVFQLFRKVYKNKNELLYNGPQSKLTRLSSLMKSKTQDVYRYELETANHNNCLLSHLLLILKVLFANCGPRLDSSSRTSLIRVHTVCLYAKIGLKSLQKYSADDINRRYFQMQVFLAF